MARNPNPAAAIEAAWLITRARQSSPNLSQSALAEQLGITQAALSKYETGQREPSTADLQRIIGHTDYRLELSLRHEPRTPGIAERLTLPNPTPFAVSSLHLARRLPTQLSPRTGQLPASPQDGPRLEEALLHLYNIRHLLKDALRPEQRLQRTYEQFHHERDRDLIHLVLPVGAGASQALTVLARAIDQGTTRRPAAGRRAAKTDPGRPRISRLVWAHIVCCLRAEEALCRDRAALLHEAQTAARQRRRAHDRAEELARLAAAGHPSAIAETNRAAANLEQARRRSAALTRHTGPDDVGTAGERYLAAELTELADRARTLYEELALEPAFHTWRAEHAAADPLYDAWLDGPLRTRLEPPVLYPDKHAFYKDHGPLATLWREALDRQEGGAAPFGSDERHVFDQFERRWQVTIAAPTTGDPRAWPKPEAVVVATRQPDWPLGEPLTPVYVLADDVNADWAAEVIAAMPASLAEVAAGLC
ncbi:helix-turn-helix transcriptional regulator [Streptomyces sp. XY431]|uniref:helix-turn-helix domain-containing protein n=1 Tax=Streptomyces sp. XY431 TaxID=1415562 RepID=UPI0013316B0F|nr:helix-turn-helix transcriptional regulator [Streptomyces sp. XY431]